MPDFLDSLPGKILDHGDFAHYPLWVFSHHLADKVEPHGNSRDALSWSIVQIPGELVASILLNLHNAVLFGLEILIQKRVVQSNGSPVGDTGE